MSYLVIARKYRPQAFSDVIGQEHITRALCNAILRDRVPHALLLCGPRGVGKTTTARIFAKALNCSGRSLDESSTISDAEPCGSCPNCKEIAQSISLAVREIDGASNNSVDNVRTLIESLRSMPPGGSRYKVYVIDEVHMLSTAAFNALLKSLEEPPPNTVFVFATTEPHKIPATVLSRCQRHDFRRVSGDAIQNALGVIAQKEGIEVEPAVLSFIARRADGGMRDAQSMFDRLASVAVGALDEQTARTAFGVLSAEYFWDLTRRILRADGVGAAECIATAFNEGLDVRQFADDFLRHWRDLYLLSYAQGENKQVSLDALSRSLRIDPESLQRGSDVLSDENPGDMQRRFEIAEQAAQASSVSNFPQYLFEAAVVKMASIPRIRPIGRLLSEIESHIKTASPRQASEYARPSGRAKEKHCLGEASNLSQTDHQDPSLKGGVFFKQDNSARLSDSGASAKSQSSISPKLGERPPSKTSPAPALDRLEWTEFVAFVKSKSPMRFEMLRRVSVKTFSLGLLSVKGEQFVIESISDLETQQELKEHLVSFTGHSDWRLNFERAEAAEQASGQDNSMSIAEREENARRAERKLREEQVRNDPGVKAALATFEGSVIKQFI